MFCLFTGNVFILQVEKIVHTRLYKGKRQYLIRWKGYNERSDTWENESALRACSDILEAFKKDNPTENDTTEEDNSAKSNKKGQKSIKTVATDKEVKKDLQVDEKQSNTESEEEKETDDSEKKSKKRVKKGGVTKKQGKKFKAENGESSVKEKDQTSKGSDDESITDGKNYEVSTIQISIKQITISIH